MNSLSFLNGKWRGDAKVTQPGGVVVNVAQEETIEYKLDSLLLQVEVLEGTKLNLRLFPFMHWPTSTTTRLKTPMK